MLLSIKHIFLLMVFNSFSQVITVENGTNHRRILTSSCSNESSLPSANTDYFYFVSPTTSVLSLCQYQRPIPRNSYGFALVRPIIRFTLIENKQTKETLPPSTIEHHRSTFNIEPTMIVTSTSISSTSTKNELYQDDQKLENGTFSLANDFYSSSFPNNFTSSDPILSIPDGDRQTIHLLILIAVISGVLLLLSLIIYAIVKYWNRDEGTYKIDESQNFVSTPYVDGRDHNKKFPSSTPNRQKLVAHKDMNLTDSREWYV